MTESDIRTTLSVILFAHLGVDPRTLTDTARFKDDLGADSLDSVEIVMAIEDEFNCECSEDEQAFIDDHEAMLTFGDAVAMIAKHLR